MMSKSYFEEHYNSLLFPQGESAADAGLRRAQLGAIFAIGSHFSLRSEPGIIVMPTGSGKTAVLMMAPFLLSAKKVLFITSNVPVRRQITKDFATLKTLKNLMVLPKKTTAPKVAVIKKQVKSKQEWLDVAQNADVVIGLPHSASPAIKGVAEPPNDLFDLILIDEAHHSPAQTWNELIAAFPRAKKILCTATPYRRDGKEVAGKIIYAFPVSEAYKDKIISHIEYVPVNPTAGLIDIDIAKAAEQVILADRKSNLKHLLMVRTDTRTRAEELDEIYKKNTSLKLQMIHSGLSGKEIDKTLDDLENHLLDGIICVDMLGEGFDFPYLKIAAIHSPHRSLEVTLQFIGRFARTNAADIGTAKFVAATNDMQIEAALLYEHGAVWKEIIVNLADTKLFKELFSKETYEGFDPTKDADYDVSDVSLKAINPYCHVKIYSVDRSVNLKEPLPYLDTRKVIYKRFNAKIPILVFVTRREERADWSKIDNFTSIQYDLFVIYYDQKNKLLFICSSSRTNALYERLSSIYKASNPIPVPQSIINKVFSGLSEIQFSSVGMKNRVSGSNNESYRMMTGADVGPRINRSDGKLFHLGHGFARAKDGVKTLTLGASASSKVWSNLHLQIPDFILWCTKQAERIRGFGDSLTHTELDHLPTTTALDEVPNDVVAITADWNDETYRALPTIVGKSGKQSNTCIVTDLALSIDRASTTKTEISFVVEGMNVKQTYKYSFGQEILFSVAGNDRFSVERGSRTVPLVEYLNQFPLSVFFSDCSKLSGREFLSAPTVPVELFDGKSIQVIDWAGSNVDIENEKSRGLAKRSIHEHLESLLVSQFPVVFYDDGTGELADYITLSSDHTRVLLQFYHCKASLEPKPGDRVDDVYEVLGQAVKSARWFKRPAQIFQQLNARADRTKQSEYKKGDSAEVDKLLNDNNDLVVHYEVIIVQPAIKASKCKKISENLSATSDYVKISGGVFSVWGSG